LVGICGVVWEFINWPNVGSKISFVINICKSWKEKVLKNINILVTQISQPFTYVLVVLPETSF
jgi:hypothetical protein